MAEDQSEFPPRISHYLIEDLLGEGGFGRVYRAYDTRLERNVAIKVITGHEERETFINQDPGLGEARILASLDHPHIVPVFDVGSTDSGSVFIVSKLIEGETLAAQMSRVGRHSPADAARLLAKMARALHFAHEKGLVHRDVKPSNIVIDRAGEPILIDFGVALIFQSLNRKVGRYVGTAPYMSPEQARGESHLVSGRADIFSIGVILYEMLTGSPVTNGDTAEMLDEIARAEFSPPSHLEASVPPELERVCLAALSRSPADRPESAAALAESLEAFARGEVEPTNREVPVVVPKGLQSFDEHDADFFLDLVPGPRDSEGLPASIRFWKQKIETGDAEKSFRVGLIYGPSGCGKSSLIKSGLVPQLGPSVTTIFLEADEATPERLLEAVHRRFPRLDGERKLSSLMRRIREGEGAPLGCKVLLVIDQFEQYLHFSETDEFRLIDALRQCDGARLMTLLLVRDDFWMGVSKFFSKLEVKIDTGTNAGAVDLFDLDHAELVLVKFGRAFNRLPSVPERLTRDETRFVQRSIEMLADDSRVVPVKLALFADMFKSRPWKPASLVQIGGMKGLGVSFLEECFGRTSQDGISRWHGQAAAQILSSFLPDSSAEIKGQSRTYEELVAVSGYGDAADVATLMDLLVKEYRLVRPTSGDEETGDRRYGLTHDYLVPSIRKWSNLRKLDTRSGRAEIKLREIADRWSVTESRRLLPSVIEWCSIKFHTSQADWTPLERRLMKQGGQRVARIIGLMAVVAAAVSLAVWEINGRMTAQKLLSRLSGRKLENIEGLFQEMRLLRRWVNPMLKREIASRDPRSMEVLPARMALYSADPSQQEAICEFLFRLEPSDFGAICQWVGRMQPAVEDYFIRQSENLESFSYASL